MLTIHGSTEPYMRGSFVLRMALDCDFDNGKVEGPLEEVDPGSGGIRSFSL
jgi:hypothetical protein